MTAEEKARPAHGGGGTRSRRLRCGGRYSRKTGEDDQHIALICGGSCTRRHQHCRKTRSGFNPLIAAPEPEVSPTAKESRFYETVQHVNFRDNTGQGIVKINDNECHRG